LATPSKASKRRDKKHYGNQKKEEPKYTKASNVAFRLKGWRHQSQRPGQSLPILGFGVRYLLGIAHTVQSKYRKNEYRNPPENKRIT
jgi:hypothetical protein